MSLSLLFQWAAHTQLLIYTTNSSVAGGGAPGRTCLYMSVFYQLMEMVEWA